MNERENAYYHAFLLRFWRDGDSAAWRASLEDPHSGERHNFGDLQQLWSFLQERLAADILPNEGVQ